MDELRVLHDDIAYRVAAISEHGWPCRKGCDGCCRSLSRQPVLSEAEWLLLAPRLTAQMRQRIVEFADSKVCPLLEDGTCSVYDVRPVACRTYGFYVDREGGLYCSVIDGLGKDVVWGNGEAVERRLDAMGPRRSLNEWVT
jgi:Fe-S-cluster containining protein